MLGVVASARKRWLKHLVVVVLVLVLVVLFVFLVVHCFFFMVVSSSAICFSIRSGSTKPSLKTMLANCFISMVGAGRWFTKCLPKSSNVTPSRAVSASRFVK